MGGGGRCAAAQYIPEVLVTSPQKGGLELWPWEFSISARCACRSTALLACYDVPGGATSAIIDAELVAVDRTDGNRSAPLQALRPPGLLSAAQSLRAWLLAHLFAQSS
jgi:hypothetical protein